MRITLIGTRLENRFMEFYNLAIRCLKSCALQRAYNHKIFLKDIAVKVSNPEVPVSHLDNILSEDPEIIGLSGYCWDYDSYKVLIPEIKKRLPCSKIILGGPLATLYGIEAMQEIKELDIVVAGEGEETFSELLEKRFRNIENVHGIIYRDDRGLKITEKRELLHEVPSPYISDEVTPPGTEVLFEFARGCKFKCRYCTWSFARGKNSLRYKNEENIENELIWAKNKKYDAGIIIDSIFNHDNYQMKIACEKIKKHFTDNRIKFSIEFHNKYYNKEQLAFLKDIPFAGINIGLETLNNRALRECCRPSIDRDQFKTIITEISSVGPVVVNVILGMIEDSITGFKETMDYLFSINKGQRIINTIYLSRLVVPHGSYFYRNKERYKLKIAEKGVPYIESSESFPEKDLRKSIDYFYNHPQSELIEFSDNIDYAENVSGYGNGKKSRFELKSSGLKEKKKSFQDKNEHDLINNKVAINSSVNKKQKACVISSMLSCDSNSFLSTRIMEFFRSNGYSIVDNPEYADIITITTCAFEEKREKESVDLVRDFVEKYLNKKKIIISGCLPKINPLFNYINGIETVSFDEIDKFNELFNARNSINQIYINRLNSKFCIQEAENDLFYLSQKNYYIQICQGCVNNCSYCVIKKAKGHVKSKPAEDIIKEFKMGLKEKSKRFVLLADDCGSYGLDINTDFAELINSLNLYSSDEIKFLIHYIEPNLLIKLYPKIDKSVFQKIAYMNIPIQTNSARLLDLMNRKYDVENILNIIRDIKKRNKHIYLETHILFGFPSETREEFTGTFSLYEFFDRIFFFCYTDRNATIAATYPDKISIEEKTFRTSLIIKQLELQKGDKRKFIIGSILPFDEKKAYEIAGIQKKPTKNLYNFDPWIDEPDNYRKKDTLTDKDHVDIQSVKQIEKKSESDLRKIVQNLLWLDKISINSEVYAGWIFTDMIEFETSPVIVLQKGNNEIKVQVRNRDDNEKAFKRTVYYDIIHLVQSEKPENLSLSKEKIELLNFIHKIIEKNET